MTIFPNFSCLPPGCMAYAIGTVGTVMTAGLNLPADSHVAPWGEMIGSFEARVQEPNGRSEAGTAMAREASRRIGGRTVLGFMRRIMVNSACLKLAENLTSLAQDFWADRIAWCGRC